MVDGEIDFVTIECLSPLRFDQSKIKKIPQANYETGFRQRRAVTKDTVLSTIKRRICQAYPFLDEPERPLAFNQDVALLRPKLEEVSSAYLAAYLGCNIGQAFANREQTEQMNPYLSLDGLRNLPIIVASTAVQQGIEDLIREAHELLACASAAQNEASNELLGALGLRDWSPPEPLTYTRAASALPVSKRLDAEFSAPKVQALLERLSRTVSTVGSVARVRREKFKPEPPGSFRYIEIGDLDGFGRCASSDVALAEAPSRATWHVRAGDVLTSTVRPLRRLSAIIAPEQDGYVCSSGFVVLDPAEVSPELLLTYLRLPLVCELMHLFATASMYPALSEADLVALPMPYVKEVDGKVQQLVRESARQLENSERLLEAAKRAVEIAIEQDEAAALRFIARPYCQSVDA